MKAIAAFGGLPCSAPGAFALLELPDPVPGPQDLLVRVEAVAVNPVDTKVRFGLPGPGAGAPPRLLGWDAAGVVEATGDAVERFVPGDRVWFAGDISRPGCNAERVLVEEAICGHRPANLSAAEAASSLALSSFRRVPLITYRLIVHSPSATASCTILVVLVAAFFGATDVNS